MTDRDSKSMTFAEASNRALSWLIAGLVAWLCWSTLALRDGQAQQMAQLAVIIDRQDRNKEDLAQLHNVDSSLQNQISELQSGINRHENFDKKTYLKINGRP